MISSGETATAHGFKREGGREGGENMAVESKVDWGNVPNLIKYSGNMTKCSNPTMREEVTW